MPLVYVLCCDKSTATYRRIFEEIVFLEPAFNPPTIVVDFELATIKAIKQVFPNANIQGCNFHFKKNIIHNLGQNGLKSRYENDVVFAHEVRMLMALGFIPPGQVVQAFEYFERNAETLNVNAQNADENVKSFVTKYFANHYIGKVRSGGERGKPQFDVQLWNVHQSTLNGIIVILLVQIHHSLNRIFFLHRLTANHQFGRRLEQWLCSYDEREPSRYFQILEEYHSRSQLAKSKSRKI